MCGSCNVLAIMLNSRRASTLPWHRLNTVVDSKQDVESKQIVRSVGALVAVVTVLLIVVFNAYGLIKFTESFGDLWFLVIGAFLTLAFQLIVYPGKFAAKSKNEQVPASMQLDPRWKGIEIYRNNDELPPLSGLFSKAKTRVNILAIDAGIMTKKSYADFVELLKRGIIVRFVLLDEQATLLLNEITKAGLSLGTLMMSFKNPSKDCVRSRKKW
jgi:hypothetical protein